MIMHIYDLRSFPADFIRGSEGRRVNSQKVI